MIGGIMGDLFGRISDCYTLGNITVKKGNYDIGGITSYTRSDAILTDCYATGSLIVEGNTTGYMGGITGRDFTKGTSPKNCIALNNQITKGNNHGRIVGGGIPLNCYASKTLSGWADIFKNGLTLPTDIDFQKLFTNKDVWTFTEGSFPTLTVFGKKQPTPPLIVEHAAEKPELNLSNLRGATTLTYTDGQWIYKNDDQIGLFNGTVTGTTKYNINVASTGTLTLADKVSIKHNITTVTDAAITLNVATGGTATIHKELPASLTVAPYAKETNGWLLIYGESTGSTIKGLMQWKWANAPTTATNVVVYDEQEKEIGITFACPAGNTTFAANIPANVTVKLKATDKVQQGKLKTGETIANATNKFSGDAKDGLISYIEVKDIEPAQTPNKDTGITITSGNEYKEGTDPTTTLFDGSVEGDILSITVDGAVKNNPTIILNEVKKDDTTPTPIEIEANVEVTLAIKGKNSIGVTVAADATLKLIADNDEATRSTVTVINNGNFTSETRLIMKVDGDASLEITEEPTGEQQIVSGESYTMNVKATGATLTYQWQSYDENSKEWKDIANTGSTPQLRAIQSSPTSENYTTNNVGEYRCLVTSEGNNATTILSTRSVKVTQTSDPDPTPDPTPDPDPIVYHSVTIPALVGATTDPVAGVYQVEEWTDFTFSLILHEAYDQSNPIVTTSRDKILTARISDGKYKVEFVREDIEINVGGIKKNVPTGIDNLLSGIRLWTTAPGILHIHTDSPAEVQIYTFGGHLLKTISALNGETALPLSTGNYVVVVNNRSYKVQVSR